MITCIDTDLLRAASLLKNSEVVAIPTETVYGLAANGFDAQAVDKIFKVKERPSFNPLILHFPCKKSAMQVVDSCPSWAEQLMNDFWPGPLTLVLPKKSNVPSIVTAGKNTVAVRVPQHRVMLQLLQMLEFPLAAPSANLFGRTSPTKPEHVFQDLKGRISYILDGGNCACGIESTIIGVGENQEPVLLRPGALDVQLLENSIGKINSYTVKHTHPIAPGMMDQHYAPSTPAFLVDDVSDYLTAKAHLKLGILSFESREKLDGLEMRALSEKCDLKEAACNLYARFRELDVLDLDIILFEKVPHEGIGVAINDKLTRASKSEVELQNFLKNELSITGRKPL